jgi:hypothetical protein
MKQTNIRLMKERILKEEQETFLTQQIIKDASKAIIIDNAEKDMNLPFIGSAK